MICSNCGNNHSDDKKFCTKCGTPASPTPNIRTSQPPEPPRVISQKADLNDGFQPVGAGNSGNSGSSKGLNLRIVFGLLGVIIVVVIGVFVFKSRNVDSVDSSRKNGSKAERKRKVPQKKQVKIENLPEEMRLILDARLNNEHFYEYADESDLSAFSMDLNDDGSEEYFVTRMGVELDCALVFSKLDGKWEETADICGDITSIGPSITNDFFDISVTYGCCDAESTYDYTMVWFGKRYIEKMTYYRVKISNEDTLNVRDNATTNSSVIYELVNNQCVSARAGAENGWIEIDFDRYIAADYVEESALCKQAYLELESLYQTIDHECDKIYKKSCDGELGQRLARDYCLYEIQNDALKNWFEKRISDNYKSVMLSDESAPDVQSESKIQAVNEYVDWITCGLDFCLCSYDEGSIYSGHDSIVHGFEVFAHEKESEVIYKRRSGTCDISILGKLGRNKQIVFTGEESFCY